MTLKYQRTLPFPAVTLCNFNPFLQTRVNDTLEKAVLSLLRPQLSTDSSILNRVGTVAKKEAPPGGWPQQPPNPNRPNAGNINEVLNRPNSRNRRDTDTHSSGREKRAITRPQGPGPTTAPVPRVTTRSVTKQIPVTTRQMPAAATTKSMPGTTQAVGKATRPPGQSTAKRMIQTTANPCGDNKTKEVDKSKCTGVNFTPAWLSCGDHSETPSYHEGPCTGRQKSQRTFLLPPRSARQGRSPHSVETCRRCDLR